VFRAFQRSRERKGTPAHPPPIRPSRRSSTRCADREEATPPRQHGAAPRVLSQSAMQALSELQQNGERKRARRRQPARAIARQEKAPTYRREARFNFKCSFSRLPGQAENVASRCVRCGKCSACRAAQCAQRAHAEESSRRSVRWKKRKQKVVRVAFLNGYESPPACRHASPLKRIGDLFPAKSNAGTQIVQAL